MTMATWGVMVMVMVMVIVAVATAATVGMLRLSRTLWRETHGWQREREQQRRKAAQ